MFPWDYFNAWSVQFQWVSMKYIYYTLGSLSHNGYDFIYYKMLFCLIHRLNSRKLDHFSFLTLLPDKMRSSQWCYCS